MAKKVRAEESGIAVEVSALTAAVAALDSFDGAMSGLISKRIDNDLSEIIAKWHSCRGEVVARLERIKERMI